MRYTIIAFLLLSVGSIAQTDSISYFDNHTNDIRTITYSPDAKFIVSAGWDETIVIQRNDSASEVAQVLMDYRGAVNSIAFSRDGTYMIAGGQDGELKKYAFYSDYFEVAYLDTTLSINNAAISKVLYGPGMRSVYSADKRGKFMAYDLAKDKATPINTSAGVTAAAISMDQMSIFLASEGSSIISQYDIFGKVKKTYDGHTNDITDLITTLDRNYLISSSKDKTIRIWNIATGKEEIKFEDHTWAITDIDMDPFGTYLVSGGLDGLVHLYDLKTRKLIRTQEFSGYKVNAVAISPDYTSIVAAAQKTGVSNPAGFFKIQTYIPARKIILPPPYTVQKKKETKNPTKNSTTGTGDTTNKTPVKQATPTPKTNSKVIQKTDQVEIRIENKQ